MLANCLPALYPHLQLLHNRFTPTVFRQLHHCKGEFSAAGSCYSPERKQFRQNQVLDPGSGAYREDAGGIPKQRWKGSILERPVNLNLRDAKRCKFSSNKCREFSAALRLQILRTCPSPPPLRPLANICLLLANCLPALYPPLLFDYPKCGMRGRQP